MRYQIRLLDQNLPGLTRELALACWRTVDATLAERPGNVLYRSLYRGFQEVLKERVQAFRYCGAARVCEGSIPEDTLAQAPAHEAFAGEHVHVYLTGPEVPPEALIGELLERAVRATASRFPGRPLPGLAPALRRQIERVFEGRLFRSERCGDASLCHANEPYDPWDRTDPLNAVRRSP
jgi:hypothetical protein